MKLLINPKKFAQSLTELNTCLQTMIASYPQNPLLHRACRVKEVCAVPLNGGQRMQSRVLQLQVGTYMGNVEFLFFKSYKNEHLAFWRCASFVDSRSSTRLCADIKETNTSTACVCEPASCTAGERTHVWDNTSTQKPESTFGSQRLDMVCNCPYFLLVSLQVMSRWLFYFHPFGFHSIQEAWYQDRLCCSCCMGSILLYGITLQTVLES